MNVVTAAEMQRIDQRAIRDYGIPGMVLMENAGLRLVEFIRSQRLGPRITVVAGRGNNGGDGFVAARHLFQEKSISVWTTAPDEEYSGDALLNLQIIRKLGIPVFCLRDSQALEAFSLELAKTDMVVDAVFGTGLSRKLDHFYIDLINRINNSKSRILSVDIPSGVSADTGKTMGAAVKAEKTITFALPKLGHYLHPGAGFTGNLHVVDIGIPATLLTGYRHSVLTPGLMKTILPDRPTDGHKGTFGSVLIIAGSRDMSGAAVLSARAALRSGSGLVYIAVPRSIQPIVAGQVTEGITIPLPEGAHGTVTEAALEILQEKWQSCDAVAIGPGITQADELLPLLSGVISTCPKPLVVDADALNLLAKSNNLPGKRTAPTILTPHPGEAARLLAIPASAVQDDRIRSARGLSERFGATIVLKGAHTVIADTDGAIYFNTTGNSGMATAGSGDVLTGMISSLLAQGLATEKAAKLGVYLHGMAGDLAAEKKGPHALLAGDIVHYISKAYLRFCQNTYEERSKHDGN